MEIPSKAAKTKGLKGILYFKTVKDGIIYRYLEKFLDHKYTCEEILNTLKDFNFAYVKEQGFIPLYKRTELTDKLHEICHFNTDFEFITKSQMRTIQKQSKGK